MSQQYLQTKLIIDVKTHQDPEWVEHFKADLIHLNAWAINTEESMDFYLANEFNYITTDYPTLLLQKCSKYYVKSMKTSTVL